MQGQRLVETQSGSEQRIVAINVSRAPVIGECSVQPFSALWIHPPKRLAGHPVKEVVAGARRGTTGRGELSRIVGSAELVEARIAFTAFDVVKGADGGSFFPRRKADFINAHRNAAELRNEPRWIVREGLTVLGYHHGLDVEAIERCDPNFKRGCRRRVEGLEIGDQVTECVAHTFE